ncbi:MAG: SsrA-binding protein [Candidatus Peribacteria bacterium]|nr:MAG: SsrA-binding protein [Candidatus Peribacteria bacterium]
MFDHYFTIVGRSTMKILTKNRQAYHDYDITDTIEVGIILA